MRLIAARGPSFSIVSMLLLSGCAFEAREMSQLGMTPAAADGSVAEPVLTPSPSPRERVRVADRAEPSRRQRSTDEADMLAQAKAERDAHAAEEAQRRADDARQRTLQRLEAERRAELDGLSERLKTKAQAPARADQAVSAGAKPTGDAEPAAIEGLAAQRREPPIAGGEPGRVTVLLVLQPGNRGIRRFEKTGDPLLCVGTGCYVSTGTATSAAFMPGRKAFGFFNTVGPRAGACSNALVCVYRDVSFAPKAAYVQPVDMRIMRHDRREGQQVVGDSRCRLSSNTLDCDRAIVGPDYRLWIVPEALAREAGPRTLERALAEGLPDTRHAALKH